MLTRSTCPCGGLVVRYRKDWELDTIPPENIPEDLLKKWWARKNRAKQTPEQRTAGGRKQSDKPRCECGKYTLHSAKVSRHKCPLPLAVKTERAHPEEAKEPTGEK